MPDSPLLQLKGIDKSFPGCRANEAIDLDIQAGEIHALLGENGAGKSTLVKIIYGVLRPDHGNLWWQGKPLRVASPAAARRVGIGMVFQHFSLFEAMTVLENIALALPAQDVGALRDNIDATAESYGLALDLDRDVYELSMGERQRIEIVRSLLQNPQLLILDEPTSVLTPQETDMLFTTLRALADEGRAVLYISHKLEEVRRLCDRATILRAGRRVDHCLPAHETTQSLAEKMLGRRIDPTDRDLRNVPGEHRLKVSGLTTHSRVPHGINLSAISFAVGKGEILGIAGIAGNGQAELMTAITGESDAPD
ncbi:MAG: ATP-binding cassette domain-containing protein, partial [Pseudomonadota bacterium]|nr:ATP-binding cassette domain-containing protein [Pseudomonadota bacterium]